MLMSKRYERVTYSDHAEKELRRRPYLSKALVEAALNQGVLGTDEGGANVADIALPNKDRLALRVVYREAQPGSAYVVTLYPLGKRRTNLW